MPEILAAVFVMNVAVKPEKSCQTGIRRSHKRQNYEQAYSREYMFWYNRITKLKKNHAVQEQIDKAQTSLKQFSQEALLRKKQVKCREESAMQFIHWIIGQEVIIQEICGEGYEE